MPDPKKFREDAFRAAQRPANWLLTAKRLRDGAEAILAHGQAFEVSYLQAHSAAIQEAMAMAYSDGNDSGVADIEARAPNYPARYTAMRRSFGVRKPTEEIDNLLGRPVIRSCGRVVLPTGRPAPDRAPPLAIDNIEKKSDVLMFRMHTRAHAVACWLVATRAMPDVADVACPEPMPISASTERVAVHLKLDHRSGVHASILSRNRPVSCCWPRR
jgi:hypothetical protein